jgi:hypothetical protein
MRRIKSTFEAMAGRAKLITTTQSSRMVAGVGMADIGANKPANTLFIFAKVSKPCKVHLATGIG